MKKLLQKANSKSNWSTNCCLIFLIRIIQLHLTNICFLVGKNYCIDWWYCNRTKLYIDRFLKMCPKSFWNANQVYVLVWCPTVRLPDRLSVRPSICPSIKMFRAKSAKRILNFIFKLQAWISRVDKLLK